MSRIRQRDSADISFRNSGTTAAASSFAGQQHQQQQHVNVDFNQLSNLDLNDLNDYELTTFLSQAVEMLDLLAQATAALEKQQQEQQPQGRNSGGNNSNFSPGRVRANHSRLAASVARCLNTMPWGRLYVCATIPANLAVLDTRNKNSSKKNKIRPFALTSQEIASTKNYLRKIMILFSVVCVKLAEIAPAHIPDILAATLKFFSSFPPAAHVSIKIWSSLPPTLVNTEQQQQQQQPAAAAGGGAPPPRTDRELPLTCRDFASALTTWLESEVNVHIFRVICSVLARHEEQAEEAFHASGGGGAAMATLAARARSHCESVLERSTPKKRWPIVAHHLSWFSVMAKFFSQPHLDAVAKSLSELRFPKDPSSSSSTASTPYYGTPHHGSSKEELLEKQRQFAQKVLERVTESSWRVTVLKAMLTGLCNLEVASRQGRESTLASRRCACYVIDGVCGCVADLVNNAIIINSGGSTAAAPINNNTTLNKNSISSFENRTPQQQQQQQRDSAGNAASSPAGGGGGGGPAALLSSLSEEAIVALQQQQQQLSKDLFQPILDHYFNDVAYIHPPLACVHSVAACAAVALDRSIFSNAAAAGGCGGGGGKNVATLISRCARQLEQLLKSSALLRFEEELFQQRGASPSAKKTAPLTPGVTMLPNSNKNSNNNNKRSSDNVVNGGGGSRPAGKATSGDLSSASALPNEIPNEIIIFSHLTGCIKQLTLMDRSIANGGICLSSSSSSNWIKSLQSLAECATSIIVASQQSANNNNKKKAPAPQEFEAAVTVTVTSVFAIWVLRDVIAPFGVQLGVGSLVDVVDRAAAAAAAAVVGGGPATSSSKKGEENVGRRETRKDDAADSTQSSASKDQDEDEDEEEEESGDSNMFQFTNKKQKDASSPTSGNTSENNSSVFSHVQRMPDVTSRIWRCYMSFSQDLLPF